MATRTKKAVKSKAKAAPKKKVAPKKTSAKKISAKKTSAKKTAPKKQPAQRPAPAPKQGEGDIVSTQQLAIAEIVGDIEERMALDRLTATVE